MPVGVFGMKKWDRRSLGARVRDWFTVSGWDRVYNAKNEGGRARVNLLASVIMQAAVSGTSAGIFYTGLLVGYGINIVNISIITVIPYLASLFSLFTPYIMERFQKRRMILSVSRIAYYLVNIVGITLLPQLVHSEGGRVIGLVAVVFVANAINFTFTSAYSAWHMYHITPDVRMQYFSSTTLVSNLSGGVVLVLASLVTDSLQGQAQLNVIIALRWLSFVFALLDVYFLQKPVEPEYQATSDKPAFLDIFRLPLAHKKFRLTMLIYALYTFSMNVAASVTNTWLLEQVHVSYLYINVINALYSLAIVFTTSMWNRCTRQYGTFRALAFTLAIHVPTYIAYAFVDAGNYLWLMTLVRLVQHMMGLGLVFSVNNLVYVNLPKTDQTNYLSFYTITGNAAVFLGMMTGTAVVAAMGEKTFAVLGHSLSGVPLLLLLQALLLGLLAVFIMLVLPHVQPEQES